MKKEIHLCKCTSFTYYRDVPHLILTCKNTLKCEQKSSIYFKGSMNSLAEILNPVCDYFYFNISLLNEGKLISLNLMGALNNQLGKYKDSAKI